MCERSSRELGSLSAFDVRTFDVSTFEVRTFDVRTFDVSTFEVRTFDVRTFDVSTFEVSTASCALAMSSSGAPTQPVAASDTMAMTRHPKVDDLFMAVYSCLDFQCEHPIPA